jgi:tetratricopeptide (TPR) repeat protein
LYIFVVHHPFPALVLMFSWKDLVERRVPQYVAVYLGACWALVEFLSFAEERYGLARAWTDMLLLALALLIPSVIVYTYNHGRPGRDAWVKSEMVLIPVNVLVIVVVLLTAFGSRDLSGAVRQITLLNEDGEVVERLVAKPEHIRRLGMFNFAAPAGDTAAAWLAEGVPLLLGQDLMQDLFIDARHPLVFRARLRESGVADGAAPALALQRRLAEERHLPHFVSGTARREGGSYHIDANLYETETGQVANRISVSGPELLPLIDDITVQLKQALALPRSRKGMVLDLPVVELLTPSQEAVRAYVEAGSAMWRDDWATAERLLVRATSLDPAFAIAQYSLYHARTWLGNAQAGVPALEAAMQHHYRLPERLQLQLKVETFLAGHDMERAFAVTGMMTEMFPADQHGHVIRAQLQRYRDDKAGAIASLRRIMELDPLAQDRLLEIGVLQSQQGDLPAALATYEEFASLNPQHAGVQLRVGGTLQRMGRLAEARAALDRAVLLEPGSAETQVELAMLLRNAGELDESLRRLNAALESARTAEERAHVQQALQGYYAFRGQATLAFAAAERRFTELATVAPPLMVAVQRMGSLPIYARAGQTDRALSLMEGLRRATQGSIDEPWRIGQLELAIAMRDTVRLPENMAGVRTLIAALGLKVVESSVIHGEAVMLAERGDWAGALDAFHRFVALEPTRLDAHREIARSYRMLGRLDDAQRAIDIHLRTVPASPESNIEAARIQLAIGDTAAASAHLRRAADILAVADPGWLPAIELARLMQAPR